MEDALQINKKAVATSLGGRRPRAYRVADLHSILEEERSAWGIPANTPASKVITWLAAEAALRQARLVPEVKEYKAITRYIWGACTSFEIASTLKSSAYLSHGTALFVLGLTEQVPSTFYVNCEQSPKPSPATPLTQASINRAFSGKQRASRYTLQFEGSRYTILSGKNTGQYGVEDITGPSREPLRVTGLERTLVDIVVRPAYAGGLYQVYDAFRGAKERGASVSRVLATLRVLDYKYPYHQALGFIMERAGFDPDRLKRLRALGMEHDFYLGYGLKDPDYDLSWRIFYPKGF